MLEGREQQRRRKPTKGKQNRSETRATTRKVARGENGKTQVRRKYDNRNEETRFKNELKNMNVRKT